MEQMVYTKLYRSIKGMQSTCNHRMAPVYLIHSIAHFESYIACTKDGPDGSDGSSDDSSSGSDGRACNLMGFEATKPDSRQEYFIPYKNLPRNFP